MLTTVKGTYRQGKIELAETPTEVEEAEVLVTFLPADNQLLPNKQPLPLYGAWRGKFPADFDLDAALNEIRGEWQKEWPKESSDA